MVAGRKPKPTAQKKLEGNPGKRKLNGSEPKATPGAPDCPAYVTGEARKEWDRVIPLLAEMELLAHADLGTIATYCQAYGEAFDAQLKLNKEGLTVKVNGQVIPHPLINIRRKAQQMMLSAGSQLGLNPSARSRIHIEKTERPSQGVKDYSKNRDE